MINIPNQKTIIYNSGVYGRFAELAEGQIPFSVVENLETQVPHYEIEVFPCQIESSLMTCLTLDMATIYYEFAE